MSDIPTTSQLQSFKVVELKEKLSKVGLPTGGLKADLVKRLRKHYQDESKRMQEEEENAQVEDENGELEGGMDIDDDLKRKVAIQQHLLEQQQTLRPQDSDQSSDLLMKVQQQQQMLEAEKQKSFLEQQQKVMMERQQEALRADQERRRQEAELMKQQQMALMETQREQHVQMEQAQPPPPPSSQAHPSLVRPPPPPSSMQETSHPSMARMMTPQQPMMSRPGPPSQSMSVPNSAPNQSRQESMMTSIQSQQGHPPRPPPSQNSGMPQQEMMRTPMPPSALSRFGPPTSSGPPQGPSQPRIPPLPPHLSPHGQPQPQGPPQGPPGPPQGPQSHHGPPPGPPMNQMPGPPPMSQHQRPPIGPPNQGPHQGHPGRGPGPLQQGPPQGPPFQGPRHGPLPGQHQGPPHQGPPHQGPPHQGPPHQGPPNQPPPHPGPPHHGPQNQGPPLASPQDGPQQRPPEGQPMPPRSVEGETKPAPPLQEQPNQPKEVRLPQALEKVLAFKDVRAQEVGVDPDELDSLDTLDKSENIADDVEEMIEDNIDVNEIEEEENEEEEDEEEEEEKPQQKAKESKNRKRKKKKKRAKKNRLLQQQHQPSHAKEASEPENAVQIEYVQEQLELDPMDPNYYTFAKVFEAFKIAEPEKPKEPAKAEEKKDEAPKKEEPVKMKSLFDEDDDDEDETIGQNAAETDDGPKLSKKKLKKLTRLSVAQLKQLVSRPDVVEMHDVTAKDPRLLVHLKASKNSVPVPRHWCFKRKYLQGKRGIEKAPFELPEYIRNTGIQEMREALAEKEDQKNLKAKMREKVRPKLGNIDIDYQKLHDAFFRFQTKPKMTVHGDLYYEAKEFETRLKEKKPGNISDDLRIALGMPVGPTAEKVPPPWLIAMQRYGPPPSYPNLKIPGLNAQIPETCTFGYHAGGWGKPPVDENGKPLYGDVFGTQGADVQTKVEVEDIDKSHWGELESESEEEEEESEEESEKEEDESGLVTPAEGLVTPSGITSIPIGMETPDLIELRKKRIEDAMDQGGDTPALYQILPEKKQAVGQAMMGSSHIYDVSAVQAVVSKKTEKSIPEGIEVALNPEELDLDTAAMQAKYDQTLKEQQSQLEKEDLSDMVAEHAAKQKKRKKQQDTGKSAKKYKEFKF